MSSSTRTYIQDILVRLLQTPSPTGYTEAAIALLEEELNKLPFAHRRNHKGGLLITIPGEDASRQRLLTAHVDTLGAMVKEVLPTGRLRLTKVGGYAWNTVEGEYCTVHPSSAKLVTGTVILHNTSTHVNSEVGTTVRSDQNIEIVLDAHVDSKEAVHALGIQVGDFVSWDPRVQVTPTGYIKSRHLDDKASVAVLMGLLQTLAEQDRVLPHTVTLLISNNEEIGYGGNSNIPEATVEYLAVDMGAIGEGQTTSEHVVSICAKDGSGPYHFRFREHLTKLCQKHDIPHAVDIYPYYSSDASAAVRAGVDVIHGLIGPGVANSHAYERTHMDAIMATYKLLKSYVFSPLLEA